jgi:Tol biopolymer transport system component
MYAVKKVFILSVVLLVGTSVSCNNVETVPLPTLVPLAQIPTKMPTEQAVQAIEETPSPATETPIDENDSAEAEGDALFIGKGSIVYFNTIGEGLFLTNANGTESQQFYDLNNISRFLATSPNGEWLTLGNGGNLYNARTNGSAINEMIGVDGVSRVSWSPTNDRFAFILDGNVFTINADGREQRQLTDDFALSDPVNALSWSPNNNHLLLPCNVEASDICLIASQGNEPVVNLTNSNEPVFYRELQWSRDGNLISFVSPDQEGNLQIFTMKTDGSDITQLTDTGENILHAWSPDGSRIAFATVEDNQWEAHMMNMDGLKTLIISAGLPSGINSIYPFWSPDGNSIGLFFTLPDIQDEFSVAVWSIEDSRLTILTDRARWAEWSPDGTQMAILSPDLQIQIVNSDGSGNAAVIECPEGCEFFTWLP